MRTNVYLGIFGFYTVVLVVILYLYFFADASSNKLSGRLSRFFTRTLPAKLRDTVKLCLGSRIVDSCGRVSHYVLHERNHLLTIAYLVVINSAFLGWLVAGEPQLPTVLASKIHSYIGLAGVIACQISFYFAVTTSPGRITAETVNHFNHVPYDGLLYVSGKICKTCKIPKIARSKHCSLCGYCVPIFDHHCVWLNQCVGEMNHKYFLSFLLINSAFFLYAAYVVTLVLLSEVYEKDLMNALFYNHITGEEFRADTYIVATYVINKNSILFSVWIVAFIMGIAVTAFTIYHLYLLWAGTTTNEVHKWSFVKKVHKELKRSYMAFKAAQRYGGVPNQKKNKHSSHEMSLPKEEHEAIALSVSEPTAAPDTVEPVTGLQEDSSSNENIKPISINDSLHKALSTKESLGSDVVGCVPVGFLFNEPNGYKKQFVRSIMDKIDNEEEDFPDYLEEDPGPMPANIYKIGFWKTLWRVYVTPPPPRSSDIKIKKKK